MERRPAGGDLPGLGIRRPLTVIVLNLLIVIAGLGAFFGVEVRELPDVDRPIVTVRATYPGASPETMDTEVTRIIEAAAARVTGVYAIRSSSEESSARIRVEFDPSVDIVTAANDLREAVSRAERDLPEEVEDLVVIKADADASPIMRLAAAGLTLNEAELTERIENVFVPALLSVPGVADVQLFGDRERVLRVVIDHRLLAGHGLSVDQVAETMRTARFDVPAGSFKSDQQDLVVRADASVWRVEDVERLAIRGTTRIGDVADVFFGPADPTSHVRLDGRTVVGMGIVRQAGANSVAISDGIDDVVARLNAAGDDVEIVKTSDDAIFIRGSIREVLTTLAFAVVIVVAVIGVFMGALGPTLIPAVTIPVALVGTIAAIWAMGFSINILTLLALVLATGLIVDDAIVVLENIQRRRSHGLAARAAAVLGTRQVFFAVLATTATLISVFLPISFLPSTAGSLFREFGFVLAIAVAISSFVALTLCPMLASRLPGPGGRRGPISSRRLARFGARLEGGYRRLLDLALGAPVVVAGLALVVGVVAVHTFAVLDEELLPDEDRGVLVVSIQGPDGVGLAYSDRQTEMIEGLLEPLVQSGEVENLFTIVGRWDPNRAIVIAPLSPWADRERSLSEIAAFLDGPLSEIPGAQARILRPNSLGLRGMNAGFEVALTGSDYAEIADAADAFAAAIDERLPGMRGLNVAYRTTQPQLSVEIDRRRAEDLGIPLSAISATLRAMVDGYEAARIAVGDEMIPVMLTAAAGAVASPDELRNLFVSTADSRVVPLSQIVTMREGGIASELERHGQRRAIEVGADLAPGYPLRQAMTDLRTLADEVLPPGIGLLFLGEAAALDETSYQVALTFAIAVLVVFLVLVAQFESVTSAAVVIVTVPFGIAAAVFALALTGTTINIYSQIGLVMLVGLMAKNGILVVEFADQLRDRGYGVHDAVRTAALVRLRPVVMTMLSTVLGGLPLILSGGPGAEARAAIGWVVFGGLGIATLFTLFLAPVAYLGLARLSRPRAHEGELLERELEQADRVGEPRVGREPAE